MKVVDKRLFQQAQSERRWLILTVGLGVLGGVLVVGQAYLLSRAVALVFIAHQTFADVGVYLVGLLVAAAIRAVLAWGSHVTGRHAATGIKAALRERLFAHILTLGPAYTRAERSGELVNTLTEGIEALDAYFSQYIPQLALAALIPLTILFAVFPLDALSGLVLLLTAPLIPIFMILIGSAAGILAQRQWTTLSRMSAHFLDVLQGLTTLKLFGRSRAQVAIIGQISDQFRVASLDVLRVAFLSALVLEMVGTISTAVVAVEIGVRLLDGRLAFEQAFFILVLAPEFYLPLRTLGIHFHAGTAGVTAAQRIFEVLETAPEVVPSGQNVPIPTYAIRFDNVWYAYGHRYALTGVSFEVRAGERVALVGPSGAGKSTILSLLLRFIEPQSGLITVGGVPLRDVSLSAWRNQIMWVGPNPYLFNTTVADNIRLACPTASDSELNRAAQLAHADTFIQSFPQGYATIIGERGARLSGGQAQRIALARAFLKNAPILLLDEATANLDPTHEALIQESVAQLAQGRTVLFVGHRLSTVHHADRVIVLDGGRVVASGTHESLLHADGVYRQLVMAYGG
ncbi:MAG: thiol reductant ABC exporter subunit CydD [Anaerolineae bacterium]|nr:thiol reductant ABC exporter subunit CydD [Anaerolineae bacterium]